MDTCEFMVNRVLDEIRPMISPEGGNVELVSFKDGVVSIKYQKGVNEKCPECIMPPEDFRAYLIDLYASRMNDVQDVQVEAVTDLN